MIFYTYNDGVKKGPFTIEELVQVKISPLLLVSNPSGDGWIEAGKVNELKDAVDSSFLGQQLPIGATEDVEPAYPPSSWLVQSILVLIFCCVPFGVVGLVYASKVDGLYATKNYKQAQDASNKARNWTLAGLFSGLGVALLYLILVIVLSIYDVDFWE